MFGFYFGSILMISSGHCCVYFFRGFFGIRGFTCGSLLFPPFVFVRGALVLRTDSLVEGLSSLTRAVTQLRLTFAVSFLFLFLFYPQLFFSAALALWYCNAVCLMRFRTGTLICSSLLLAFSSVTLLNFILFSLSFGS